MLEERKVTRAQIISGMERRGMSEQDILEWFQYHKENPHILSNLEIEFLARIHTGVGRVGMKEIAEALRANPNVTKALGQEFKLDNTQVSRYARVLATKWPEFEHLIEMRILKRVA